MLNVALALKYNVNFITELNDTYFFFTENQLRILKINKCTVQKETQNINTAHTIVKLCDIRDGIANCDVMSCTEAKSDLR